MGELLDQFIIELKNVARTLNVKEVKEEPHHSTEYYPPKRHIELFKGETGISVRPLRTPEEKEYLNRQANALENARRRG